MRLVGYAVLGFIALMIYRGVMREKQRRICFSCGAEVIRRTSKHCSKCGAALDD